MMCIFDIKENLINIYPLVSVASKVKFERLLGHVYYHNVVNDD